MIKSYEKLSKELKEEICRKFEVNYDFEALKKIYPEIDHITLYSILNAAGKYHDKIYPSLPQIDISEKKVIFMSDTQFGSKYENLSYTYDLFDFAIKNGYHIVLHGGDIIEGNINRRRNMTSIRQAHYFVDKFPHDDSITTHALYGNHDFFAMQRNEDIRAVLESREDVNMLGFKKAYIRWNGNTISLQHDIDNYKISMPIKAEYISFAGHSHYYHIRPKNKYKNEKIYIPAMCEDAVYLTSNPNLTGVVHKPGFLTAEIDDTSINVSHYSFEPNGIVKEDEFQKLLKKKNI